LKQLCNIFLDEVIKSVKLSVILKIFENNGFIG